MSLRVASRARFRRATSFTRCDGGMVVTGIWISPWTRTRASPAATPSETLVPRRMRISPARPGSRELLAEPGGDQALDRVRAGFGVRAGRLDLDDGPDRRREHDDLHHALPVRRLAVDRDHDVGFEAV